MTRQVNKGDEMVKTETEVKEVALGLLSDLHKDMLERQVQDNAAYMQSRDNHVRNLYLYGFQTRAREMDEVQRIIDTLKASA